MSWQPLSSRRGMSPPRALHQGLPPHLAAPVRYWAEGYLGYRTPARGSAGGIRTQFILRVAARAGVHLRTPTYASAELMGELLDNGEADEDLYLDIIDAMLAVASDPAMARSLSEVLADGNSVWTVRDDGAGLVERVEPAAQAAWILATEPEDLASTELVHAWEKAYGRHPDASDSWDHAIKAVEAIAIPLVVPRQQKPQMGHVIGQLDKAGSSVSFALGGETGLATLVSMLRLLWPNPDRHADQRSHQPPTIEDARMVLHLAIALVQLLRDGALTRNGDAAC